MAPDNIPEVVDDFRIGVQARDVSLVTHALDAGVEPDTAVNGRHPLWELLGATYETLPDGLQTGMTRDEFGARTSTIVNSLFDSGLKVAEEGKYSTPTQSYLVDRFLVSDNVQDAATVVIHAIHETLQDGRPPYQPDLNAFLTHLISKVVPDGADYKAFAEEAVDAIVRLHDAVRTRLENPSSATERDVARHGERLDFWTSPLARPDMAQLLGELGLQGKRVVMLPNMGALKEHFAEEAGPEPDFVVHLADKAPKQVIAEMNEQIFGLADLKKAAQRLVFRQNYDQARAEEQMPPADTASYNTAFMGFDGLGKSLFAEKNAELLHALGLAGGKFVNLTHENMALNVAPPQLLIPHFITADIIHIELEGGPRDMEGKNRDDRVLAVLQAALKERDKPPVIFLSGWQEDIDAALENNPALKQIIKKFQPVPEMGPQALAGALDWRLEKAGLLMEKDAREHVLAEFGKARSRLGKSFRNMREVDELVVKLPDAISERLFGSEENEQALMAAGDAKKTMLKTVKLEDVRSLNLPATLGGPNIARKPGIGFTARL